MKEPSSQGIVVKVTEEQIVLLCEGGHFKNVPRKSDDFPKIGQPYSVPQVKRRFFAYARFAAVAAMLFMAILSYTLFESHQAEAAYVVAIDINPKVEVYADKDLHVIKVKALNHDGERIKNSLHLNGNSLFQVIQQVIQQSIEKGYLPKDREGLITTTIIPLAKDLKPINKQIEETIKEPLKTLSVHAEVSVMSGDKGMLNEAKKENLSVNQLQFYNSLRNKGAQVTPSDIRKKTMKQLETMNSKANKSSGKSNDHSQKPTDQETPATQPKKTDVKSQAPSSQTRQSNNTHREEKKNNNPSKVENDNQQTKANTDSHEHQDHSSTTSEDKNDSQNQSSQSDNQQQHTGQSTAQHDENGQQNAHHNDQKHDH